MNQIEQALKITIQEAVKLVFDMEIDSHQIVIEIPREVSHGDYSSNIAMRLTKELKRNPREIAEELKNKMIEDTKLIENIEIAGPGFINFFVRNEQLANVISKVLKEGDDYGKSDFGKGLKMNVEFVSANPTGDLHPGHARGAAIGDSVCRILRKAGYDVTSEYYINDAGLQIDNMGKSLQARYLQAFGIEASIPEDGYHGVDLIEIAEKIKVEEGNKYVELAKEDSFIYFREYGLREELQKLKDDLNFFRVDFNVWSSERNIYERGLVQKAVDTLKQLGVTYEKEGALWLKTTEFDDDKDRVLVKSNGEYTYLTPDIAYHLDKFERGFENLVNFLGADHHGYINRLKAAVQALGHNQDDLEIDIIQMVRMIKDGTEFKLSKRTGKALALKDLLEEAGVDAIRYFFASRAVDTQMDLDLDLATKQSNENPVYYAQYAHARMCSILKQGEKFEKADTFSLLTHQKEMDLLKHINEFSSVISDAAKNRQPHRLCNYIQKLAAYFHSFYNECKVLDETEIQLSSERLALVKAICITLKNALELIGVTAPEYM